jgi:hypothetical protein
MAEEAANSCDELPMKNSPRSARGDNRMGLLDKTASPETAA